MSRGSKRRRLVMSRERWRIQRASVGEFVAGVSLEALEIEDDEVAASRAKARLSDAARIEDVERGRPDRR